MSQKSLAVLALALAVAGSAAAQNVAVVNGEDTIEIRSVTVGQRIGSLWIVESGLAPGVRVVVEGVQKVRAGAKVRAETVQIEDGSPATVPGAQG